MYYPQTRYVLIFAALILAAVKVNSQTTMPVELNKSSLNSQLNYIEEHTRIYENYRAIREDMFQKIILNVSDTIAQANSRIITLYNITSELNGRIDSLNSALETTKTELSDMTRTKNSLKVLGIEVGKSVYNSIMWTIVAFLLIVLFMGFLIFKRNMIVTINTKNELKDFINEFEAYRKTSQQARDKLYMDHAEELKKLRNK